MLLKLNKLLHIISFNCRQKSLYYELKYYIKKRKSHLKKIYLWERNIGKSFVLMKLAVKYNLPIIVITQGMVNHIKHYYKTNFYKDINVLAADENLAGKRFDIVLVDEGIREETMEKFIKPISKCVIGFTN